MAKGYVMLLLEVEDPEAYARYARAAVPTVIEHGGRAVIMGPTDHPLEGTPPSSRVVLIEFDTVRAARAWYTSLEYRELIPQRWKGAVGPVVLLEGFTPPEKDDGGTISQVTVTEVDDYTELEGAELYDTEAFTGATGGSAGDVTITGTPGKACGVSAAPTGDDANPGDGHSWYSGADQNPPMPTQLLDLSEGVTTFGVSFVHFNQAGINTTAPARLRVYSQLGGEGAPLDEALSSGGIGVVDLVALSVDGATIRSAVIDCPDQTAFSVTAYAVVPG